MLFQMSHFVLHHEACPQDERAFPIDVAERCKVGTTKCHGFRDRCLSVTTQQTSPTLPSYTLMHSPHF